MLASSKLRRIFVVSITITRHGRSVECLHQYGHDAIEPFSFPLAVSILDQVTKLFEEDFRQLSAIVLVRRGCFSFICRRTDKDRPSNWGFVHVAHQSAPLASAALTD